MKRNEGRTHTAPDRLIFLKDYCIRGAQVDCNRCTHACPVAAIEIGDDGWPSIDRDRCTKCGICLGICDAFSATKRNLEALHQHIQRIAVTGERVIITCRENIPPKFIPDDNVVVLPCISCIPPEMWSLFLAENIHMSIYCDLSYCDDCDRAPVLGGMLFPRSIQIAQERNEDTDNVIRTVNELPEKPRPTSAEDPLGRRQAFDNLIGDFSQIASGKRRLKNSTTLQDVYIKRHRKAAVAQLHLIKNDDVNALMPHGTTHHVLFPRKKMVIETLMNNPESSEKTAMALSRTDQELCDSGQGCNSTYACVHRCPSGARSVSVSEKTVDTSPLLCIGCGACEQACPEDACVVEETTAEELLSYLPGPQEDEKA